MTDLTPYQPFVEAEAFFTNGGRAITIENPNPENIKPFYDKLEDQYPTLSNKVYHSDPERFFYIIAQWAMDTCISNYYYNPPLNPRFTFSLSADNTLCGFVYSFDTMVDGESHVWINSWASLPDYKGAGFVSLLMTSGLKINDGFHASANVDQRWLTPSLNDAINDIDFLEQDPNTLWHTQTNQDAIKASAQYYSFAQMLPHMSKLIFEVPTTDEDCVFCWKNNTWYPKSQAPQDLGKSQVLESGQVYVFDIDNFSWSPFTLPWG